MALEQELTATQLLQGLQKKDPRMYDLFNIIIKNLADTRIETGVDAPRTLRKQTTGGVPSDVTPADEVWYDIQQMVSLRL